MSRRIRYISLIFLLLLAFALAETAHAQRWGRTYSGLDVISVEQTSDGNLVALDKDMWGAVRKVDTWGNPMWYARPLQGIPGASLEDDMIALPNNELLVLAGQIQVGYSTPGIVKLDAQGDTVWTKWYPIAGPAEGARLYRIRTLQNGGYAAAGVVKHAQDSSDVLLMRFDANLDTLWTRSYPFTPNKAFPQDLVETFDGGFAITGDMDDSLVTFQNPDMFLYRTDASGNLQWARFINNANNDATGAAVTQIADSSFLIYGRMAYGPQLRDHGALVRVDPTGQVDWIRYMFWDSTTFVPWHYPMVVADDGNLVVTGSLQDSAQTDNRAFLAKIDHQGNTIWMREYDWPNQLAMNSITKTNNGGYFLGGRQYTVSFDDVVLLRVDSIGNLTTCWVEGNVYADWDADCTPDIGEPGLSHRVVGLTNGLGGTIYELTDINGDYQFRSDTGTYTVDYNAGGMWTHAACNPVPMTIPLPFEYDTIQADLPTIPLFSCPEMHVSVGVFGLRPCFSERYRIHYFNAGTVAADSATIEFTLDTLLRVDSASVPWLTPQSGNTYVFPLDTVEMGESGFIDVWVFLDCNAVIGQTHCVTAKAFPDSVCQPTTGPWDGSHVDAELDCIDDTLVQFTIRNSSNANMASGGNYIVLEDNIMRQTGNFQLNAWDSLIWYRPANGSTWVLEADQSPWHPGHSAPIVSLEGCGQNGQGGFSLGFVTQVRQDDQDPFIDILCVQNVSSYDPNDKQAEPAGVDAQHYIDAEEDLEYRIRFQNTGTAPAIRVEIRDTIRPFLDIFTLRLGAYSHPYEFFLEEDKVMRFVFDDIMLPDSGADLAGSQGFVKYSIDQVDGNPVGTRLENNAAIYFDFNEPVITNTAWHTIGEDFFVVSFEEAEDAVAPSLMVYPNPFRGHTTIDLGQWYSGEVVLDVMDLQGKLLHRQVKNGARNLRLNASNLGAGMYVFTVHHKGQRLGAGKLQRQ